MPPTTIDTDAGWSQSGWHGWWYDWKRHLAVSVGSVWIPLATELTPANVADNPVGPRLLDPLPAEVRYVLRDTHANDPWQGDEAPLEGSMIYGHVSSNHQCKEQSLLTLAQDFT